MNDQPDSWFNCLDGTKILAPKAVGMKQIYQDFGKLLSEKMSIWSLQMQTDMDESDHIPIPIRNLI